MKKRLKLKKSVIKTLIVLSIFLVLCFLFYITYYIYNNSRKIEEYNKNTSNYSYLTIKEMSEAFATIDQKQLHFIKNIKNNIYIVAIPKKYENKYQEIIDYTYRKTNKTKTIKVYGLPIKANREIKDLVIKYINKFLPFQEQIPITNENYKEYIPNTILDTTIKETYTFNYIVFILFLIFGIFFLLLIFSKKIPEKSSSLSWIFFVLLYNN